MNANQITLTAVKVTSLSKMIAIVMTKEIGPMALMIKVTKKNRITIQTNIQINPKIPRVLQISPGIKTNRMLVNLIMRTQSLISSMKKLLIHFYNCHRINKLFLRSKMMEVNRTLRAGQAR